MKLLINQFFGLGDCIFCMQLARTWIAEGHKVTWPVMPQFVDQLKRAYPDVEWLDYTTVKCNYERKEEHDWNGYRVVPLRWNVQIMNVPYTECMSSKYSMFGLDWQDWRKGAMWQRDEDKEVELLKILGGSKWPYELKNEIFSSDARMRIAIPYKPKTLTINMGPIEGYSLFDWALILERATEIHTVSTSIIYILEMLDIKCPIYIYKREPIEKSHDNYSYILKSHNYILK